MTLNKKNKKGNVKFEKKGVTFKKEDHQIYVKGASNSRKSYIRQIRVKRSLNSRNRCVKLKKKVFQIQEKSTSNSSKKCLKFGEKKVKSGKSA